MVELEKIEKMSKKKSKFLTLEKEFPNTTLKKYSSASQSVYTVNKLINLEPIISYDDLEFILQVNPVSKSTTINAIKNYFDQIGLYTYYVNEPLSFFNHNLDNGILILSTKVKSYEDNPIFDLNYFFVAIKNENSYTVIKNNDVSTYSSDNESVRKFIKNNNLNNNTIVISKKPIIIDHNQLYKPSTNLTTFIIIALFVFILLWLKSLIGGNNE